MAGLVSIVHLSKQGFVSDSIDSIASFVSDSTDSVASLHKVGRIDSL